MRPIRRSKRHETLVRQLAEAAHPQAARPIFPTMRELMCFAAVLGFECKKNAELDDATMEIDGRTFEGHDQSRDLIYLLALAHERNVDILREENEDKCLAIFEQYAEGGLAELSTWLKERPEDENGDAAILAALQRRGYLGEGRSIDQAVHDVTF